MRVRCGSWRAWAAVAVLVTACGPARAFYWQNWPGSRLPPPQTIIHPPFQETPGNPPTPPGTTPQPGTPEPPGLPPVVINKPPVGPPGQPGEPGPEPTPEPSTALLGLLGVGAAAARKWWRKR